MSDEEKRDLDVYLRFVMPELPADYGAPVDGVRLLVKSLALEYEKRGQTVPQGLARDPKEKS